jgi:hypothetical protein
VHCSDDGLHSQLLLDFKTAFDYPESIREHKVLMTLSSKEVYLFAALHGVQIKMSLTSIYKQRFSLLKMELCRTPTNKHVKVNHISCANRRNSCDFLYLHICNHTYINYFIVLFEQKNINLQQNVSVGLSDKKNFQFL